MMQVNEEIHFTVEDMGWKRKPDGRADMIYYKPPNDGALLPRLVVILWKFILQ